MKTTPFFAAIIALTTLVWAGFKKIDFNGCNHQYAILPEKPGTLESDRLLWSSAKKINWEDFKASPDTNLLYIAALTSSSIVYSYYCNNDELVFTIKAVFRKNESWVRPEAKTDFYLNHELLHFDITELYARKLREKLAQYRFTCNQSADMEMIAAAILDEWRKMDKKYDLETHFSHDMQMQKDWYVFIHEQLYDYRAYALLESQ
ncbi:hypothetical protein C7N43_20385 [Sphingobacteriales bacterium UPWRP_1]|nr:hypothetical protein BVG80_02350 [Sphingobacteriales bacterium TSM_CSM]PSJ75179.1 hypothetical protein C7N43_20385 [Sphingobacteriales bacterium UPWRP_1]